MPRRASPKESLPKLRAAGNPARKSAAWPGRFPILFGAFLLLGFGVLLLPPVQVVDARFSQVLVRISHTLIGACGGRASVDGAILRAASGFAIEMRDGCNAVNVTILLWAAIMAFPAGWKMKTVGALGGSVIIQIVNVIRFITLFYIGQYSVNCFDFAHKYLWETLIVLDTMVVFWVWVNRVSRCASGPNVST